MSNTDQDLKDLISDLLGGLGLEVAHLEERDEQTPDLLAVYQDERYIIEAKSKKDNEELLREEEVLLAKGEIVKHFEAVGHSVPIARVIESAIKQIRSLPPRDSDFRLLWLHAQGSRRGLQLEQFHETLYGTTSIIDLDGNPSRRCYYFYQNVLHKFREELDGVILSDRDSERGQLSLQLCLNNFSPRCASLRQSFLASSALKDGICDPEELERAGVAFIADGPEDRHNSEAVICFLQKKYGRTNIQKMDMGYYEFGVRCL